MKDRINNKRKTTTEEDSSRRCRAVVYRRAASVRKHGPIPQLARQRRVCRRLADALGAEIVGEYDDAGQSGRDVAGPGLTALRRRFTESPQIDDALASSRDRIARSVPVLVAFEIECEQAGVRLVTGDGPVDTPFQRVLVRDVLDAYELGYESGSRP